MYAFNIIDSKNDYRKLQQIWSGRKPLNLRKGDATNPILYFRFFNLSNVSYITPMVQVGVTVRKTFGGSELNILRVFRSF